MKRTELFDKALLMSKQKYKLYPNYFVLKAIIAQLEYLSSINSGDTNDLSKLNTILVGRMTAHDIDSWDPKLAETLHLVAEEARKMSIEYGD